MGKQHQTGIRQNNIRPFIQDTPDDAPLAGDELIRAVDVGIAEVGGGRVGVQDGLLGLGDQIREAQLLLAIDHRRVFRNRHFQAGREQRIGVHIAPIAGHPTDPDKAADFADQGFGHKTDAAIGHHGQIKGPLTQGLINGFPKVRVAVNMFNLGRYLGNFVGPAVKNRDLIAPFDQAIDDKRAGRASPSDDKCFHLSSLSSFLASVLTIQNSSDITSTVQDTFDENCFLCRTVKNKISGKTSNAPDTESLQPWMGSLVLSAHLRLLR